MKVIAHRGASGDAPENTLAAFRLAQEQGADVIETDVQLTADRVPVLVHDNDLTRTTDAAQVYPGRRSYQVGDFNYGELAKLDAGSWNSPAWVLEPIPRLEQALELLAGGTGLLLELKRPRQSPGVEEVVAGHLDDYLDRYPAASQHMLAVASLNWDAAQRYQQLRPQALVGALVVHPDTDANELAKIADYAGLIGTGKGICSAAQVDRLHHYATHVVCNTSTARDASLMLDRSADAVTTDYPGRMRDVVDGVPASYIEAEDLLPPVESSAPVRTRSNVGMNGGKWSNNSDLVFEGSHPGDAMTLAFDGPGDGALWVVLSKGPDGGVYDLTLDGRLMLSSFDAYRPSVARETVSGQMFSAAQERHLLTFSCVGKHPDSAGYQLGCDVIILKGHTPDTAAGTSSGADDPVAPGQGPDGSGAIR